MKQTKPTSSTLKRDTFTYSSPTVKQTVPKTTAKTTSASKSTTTKASPAKTTSIPSQTTAKTNTSAKSTQTNKSASAVKTNTTAKTSNAKTSSAAKSASVSTATKRDTFTYSSEAVKNAVKSATSSKSAANSKSTVQNNVKNTKNSQTKTAVKSNSSNKSAASGTVSKSNTNSSKKAMLESMQKAYEHTKDPKQREAMRKTMNDIAYELSSKKTNKTTDIIVNYDRSKIKSQFEYYDGDKACYATSADNMWRVNDGAVGNKIIQLEDKHKKDGILDNAPHNKTTYISDSGKVFTNNGQTSVNEYYGKDNNGNEYTAVRIQGLSKDDYNELVLQELNKDKIVCVRVVKEVGQDPKRGHTMNIVGTNENGEFLYEDCGRYPTPLSNLKPATLTDTGYTNNNGVKREYFEVQDGQYEIWIDTTK